MAFNIQKSSNLAAVWWNCKKDSDRRFEDLSLFAGNVAKGHLTEHKLTKLLSMIGLISFWKGKNKSRNEIWKWWGRVRTKFTSTFTSTLASIGNYLRSFSGKFSVWKLMVIWNNQALQPALADRMQWKTIRWSLGAENLNFWV